MDIAAIHEQWDQISVEALREIGGAKWSRFPDRIGSFIAEMDFGIAPEIEACIADYATSRRHGYATPPWPQETAKAFAGFAQQRYGWAVDPDLILPVADVLSAMDSAIDTFTNPGEAVVVPTPAYMNFFPTLRSIHRPIIEVPSNPEDGWALDLDGIDRALAQGATSVVLCNPQNPSGRVYTEAELLALAEVVDAHKAFVFSDEIHAPITLFGHRHHPYAGVSATTAAHTVTSTSPSKAWNIPGHRCAQLLFHDADRLAQYKAGPYNRYTDRVPNLGLFTNATAYANATSWLDTVIPYLERNVRLLDEAIAGGNLPGVELGRDYQTPEGTYLIWMNLAHTPAANDPAGFIAEHAGVQATGGRSCGKDWGTWLRLNLATPTPIWQDVIARIGTALSR